MVATVMLHFEPYDALLMGEAIKKTLFPESKWATLVRQMMRWWRERVRVATWLFGITIVLIATVMLYFEPYDALLMGEAIKKTLFHEG